MVLPLGIKNKKAKPQPAAKPLTQKRAANNNNDHHGGGSVCFDKDTPVTKPPGAMLPRTPHPKKKQRLTNDGESIPMNKTTSDYENVHRHHSNNVANVHNNNEKWLYRADDNKENSATTEPVVEGVSNEQDMVQSTVPSEGKLVTKTDDGGTENNQEQGGSPYKVAEEVQDPDWDVLGEHEPARSDIPVFLAARERRAQADKRFAEALDECNEALQHSVKEILDIAVEYYDTTRDKLDTMEANIIHHFVQNHEVRTVMQQRLQETAQQTQGLFAQLMMRVVQPFMSKATTASAAPPSLENGGDESNQQQP